MAIEIKENVPLAPYTIYKIGGMARFFAEVRNGGELKNALEYAGAKGAPFFIMGAGSNVLVADTGYEGMVIRMTGGEVRVTGNRLIADAGVMMARAVGEAARAGLTGFEWGIGVPGTIGGSVRGNAGCFGGEMKDIVESVEVFDSLQPATYTLQALQCVFGYRDSVFKKHPGWIVLSATLQIAAGDPAAIQERVRRITAERLEKQSIGTKSCGCIFKNVLWPDAAGDREALLARFPELAAFAGRPAIPASFLLDAAGMKGARAGGAVVSEKHANFFVNEGNAKARDVARLAAAAQDAVHKKYGLALHEEIQYVGSVR